MQIATKCGVATVCLLASWLLASVAGSSAHVAQGQDDSTLTLQDAVRIALEQNTDVRRARNDVALSAVRATQERMDFLPDLQVTSSGTRSFGRSFSQEEGAIINETSDFFGTEANASVNLFNGFEHYASLRRADLQETASTQWLARTREDVVYQVMERYTALLQNRQLAEVREEEYEVQGELLEQVRGLVDVGRRPRSDLYQQQAAVAEARAAVAAAQREVELSRTQLIQVLQLDPFGSYTFQEVPLPDTAATADLEAFDLGALLETAFEQRADLDAIEADVAAAQQGVRVARSGYWPSLSLSVGYGSDWSSTALSPVPGTGTDPRTVTVSPEGGGEPVTFPVPGTGSEPAYQRPAFFDQLDRRRGGALRLSLNIPIFDRLQRRVDVETAQLQEQNARYDLQDRRQQVALQVRQGVFDYRSAQTQLGATEERLQAADQAREAAQRRYELGAATFVELNQAIAEHVSAQSAYVRARYDVFLAHRRIGYFTGRLEPNLRSSSW